MDGTAAVKAAARVLDLAYRRYRASLAVKRIMIPNKRAPLCSKATTN